MKGLSLWGGISIALGLGAFLLSAFWPATFTQMGSDSPTGFPREAVHAGGVFMKSMLLAAAGPLFVGGCVLLVGGTLNDTVVSLKSKVD